MKKENKYKKAFTLIELLIVISIIGILTGVVMVSSGDSVKKSKKASALTTAASILPELVSCQDDGGVAKSTAPAAGNPVCCTTVACGTKFSGHSVTWPNISAKTGWDYAAPSGTLAGNDYEYRLTKTDGGVTDTITCSYANNECS